MGLLKTASTPTWAPSHCEGTWTSRDLGSTTNLFYLTVKSIEGEKAVLVVHVASRAGRSSMFLSHADELLRRYCTIVYAQTGSYQDTARRRGIDRRTARVKVDQGWLEQLRAEG